MTKTLVILPIVLFVLTACATVVPEPTGMVIVNARVIDGSGGPSRDVNVRILEDRIAAVGDFEPPAEDTIVDADGLVLAPGFIDTHSHHERHLFELPEALAAVNQGITTMVVGQDGKHPWPLTEFFGRLEATPVAVNVASHAGHGTLRRQVMGEDFRRQARPNEVEQMAELLAAELHAGALGLSSGLEYDPGSYSSTQELIELAKMAAAHGGIYHTHVRNEDQYFWEAIDEAIEIGREARVPTRVTHIKLGISRWWGQTNRLMSKLNEARASGVDISADLYSFRVWYSGFSWFRTLFPERDLDRHEGAEYILNDMLSPDRIVIPDFRPNPDYNNMSIAEIAELRGQDAETTLMELLKEDAGMGGDAAVSSGSSVLAAAMDESDIEAIMGWPHTVIASDGDSQGAHPRGYSTFTRFLGHYVREREVVSFEEGVRKITSLPAEQVGIAERGAIREGYFADLVLFDPDTVAGRATFEDPHVPSTGIERVWVNGQLVYADGQITGERPGKPIRAPR